VTSRRVTSIVCLWACSLVLGISTARAQDWDPSDCERACQADYQACTEECAQHSDPVECDSDCRDQLEDCSQSCR